MSALDAGRAEILAALKAACLLCATLDEFGVGELGVTEEMLVDVWRKVAAAQDLASGTSGSAQDAQRLDPKGAGPTPKGGDAQ